MANLYIFDTTLRDGEQAPGMGLGVEEKLEIAKSLENLGCGVIEAGFPASSEEDYKAVELISKKIKKAAICAFARATEEDIDKAGSALRHAEKSQIEILVPTSDIHLKYKLGKTRDQAVELVKSAVGYAVERYPRSVTSFAAEDAPRSDVDYLLRACGAAVDSGARVLGIADTVGYCTPAEYGGLIKAVREKFKDTIVAAHCHDDLGLAVANTLAAVENGANELQCTVNGIGERAGNAALEEVVMALATRKDYFKEKIGDYSLGIKTEMLYPTSRLVARLTGAHPPPNKAIVGSNAFATEAGIHQQGILKNPSTYEIMRPENVGQSRELVLGKHSGRNVLRERLQHLGFTPTDDELNIIFKRFKHLFRDDPKKRVGEHELRIIIHPHISGATVHNGVPRREASRPRA